jgi:hypothetical protein
MCDNCIHQPVCSIYRATGGVKSCEHHKEERTARWVPARKGKDMEFMVECSYCHVIGSPRWKSCPVCEAKMEGTEDGKA